MSTTAKLSLAEYERMVATGVFDSPRKRRIELIRGELRDMAPIGPSHCEVVDRLNRWSIANTQQDKVRIRIQNPVAFETVDTEPEPDIVWAVEKSYKRVHPTGDDILLLIEVADSSFKTDRGEKAEIYAEVGIRDYWIVNLRDQVVEVFRDPERSRYRSVRSYEAGEFVEPLETPGVRLSVEQLFAD